MPKRKAKTAEIRSICFRRCLMMLLSDFNEDDIIYAYATKDQRQIRYIEFTPFCKHLNTSTLTCYKTTIKKLYLHLISLSYPNTPRENLVVIANRLLRRKTVEDCAKLLHMSIVSYKRIEDGTSDNFNLKEIARMLNFKEEEFYYNFQTTLECYEKGKGENET